MPLRIPLLAAALAAAPLALSAQSASTPADTSSAHSASKSGDASAGDATPTVTYGATAGTLSLSDGRTQRGVTAVVRWHPLAGLALGVTPAFAQSSYPASLGGGSASGLTDLPVELSYDHAFSGSLPTTLGLSFGVSLPVGDTATGFGSGTVGYSVDGGASFQPMDKLSLHVGAGRSLTDYSFSGALGGSNAAWGDLEGSYQFTDRVGGTLGLDGDLTSGDSLGAARTLVGGVSYAVAGPLTLTVNAAHGISGPAASWQFAVGIGTDFAGLQSLGSSSPVQRIVGALGGRSHAGSTGRPSWAGGGTHGRP